MKRIVIVGGVAGGASAAARARRLDENAEIIMLERGEHISFANCGLPYHIGGEIEQRDALLLQTPASFSQRFRVDVRVRHEAVAIDRQARQLSVRDLGSGQSYQLEYDKLLLSPGAEPIRPPLPGVDLPGVLQLRNVADMDAILTAVNSVNCAHATVVGGGFIGLEVAEQLRHRGKKVTVLEQASQVMAPVDAEMAVALHDEIRCHEVDLRLGAGLAAINKHDAGFSLALTDGHSLNTDLVVLAIGVKPEVALARDAGLTIGDRGGIVVNGQMQTSDPNIFAVGDAVEKIDLVTGQSALIPLAGPANRQGRVAGEVMVGGEAYYGTTQGTAICRVFNLTVASTGINEKTLIRQGLAYSKIYVHAANHASYYPGAFPISLKLLFNPESGQLLGAQAVGKEGVDKRIDVLAVALRAGMTVYDLQDFELTYAPPYGSAKDVVNLAGFVAVNHLRGITPLVTAEHALHPKAGQQVLDVRNPSELAQFGEIAGAINIPLDELRQRLDELDKNIEYLATCQVGLRSHVAARLLRNLGFNARNITGGYKTLSAVRRLEESL